MSSDGVIENNRIERTKSAAISVGCEYGYWREAGWVKNIIIRNNRLKQIGRGSMTTPDSYTPGAISVFAKLEDYSGSCRGNRNILIEKNSINGSEGAGIFVFRETGSPSAAISWRRCCRTNAAAAMPSRSARRTTSGLQIPPSPCSEQPESSVATARAKSFLTNGSFLPLGEFTG